MKIVGVDLGTTNSCIYYLDDQGNPVLVEDKLNRKIFPSVVWSAGEGREVIVGHKAKSRLGQQPPPVVAVKRLMGTTETVSLGGERVTSVQVSAHILRYAKQMVEEMTNDQVGGVVVTMPAYFDSAPKQDTCKAAIEAFFNGDETAAADRLALQLEPEAAAYAYTIEDPADRLKILVYDLGGGTFDVTILEKSPEAGLHVLKFGGDPHLGGDNVDDRIAAWILYLLRGGMHEVLDRILDSGSYTEEKRYVILQQILTNDVEGLRGELSLPDRDLLVGASPRFALKLDPQNPEDLARIHLLKSLAERAKMDLTTSTEATITRQGAFQDQEGETVDIDLTLSRGDFNRLIGDLVSRTIEATSLVIKESGLRVAEIDRLLLVGGSSRMPCIAEELQKTFNLPIQMKDPDLIVARGAAFRGRDLNPPPLAVPGEEQRLALEYPRQTPDRKVNIRGQVDREVNDYRVYVSRDGAEEWNAPVNGGRFIVADVTLVENAENTFRVEVTDPDENIYAQAEIAIRHDPQAVSSLAPLSTSITKPIRILGIRGFKTVIQEGEMIPVQKTVACHRATLDDFIIIPFFEGERWLDDLRIEPVDPSLPKNAAIDVKVTFNADYTLNAIGTVRATNQNQTVTIKIERVAIPNVGKLDDELDETLEQLENDLALVRDPNARAGFSRRMRRLDADYRKARRELTPNMHHLYSIVSELKKLLVEVRGAQNFLTPPFEEFEKSLGVVRRLAGELEDQGALTRRDVLEKIAALEKAGKDAWDREDAANWKSITGELERLKENLRSATLPPRPDPRQFPPEFIQREMLAWIGKLREQVRTNHLENRFDAELDQVEGMIRRVDLRQADQARGALFQIIQDQLKPLDNRIERAIRETGGDPGSKERRTTVDW